MQNFIIIANGDFLTESTIYEAIQGQVIVALDGAVNKLAKMGIKPHVILGDFDSINEENKERWGIKHLFAEMSEGDSSYAGKHNVLIVPAKSQTYTDLTKAIHYCDAQQAKSISIICALGGRLDHHEGAVHSLRSTYKKERPILLHSELQSLRFAKDETIILEGTENDKCGIVGFPKGSFSSSGLQYDVKDYALELGFSDSICNSLREKKAILQICGEVLIFMPPQLKSHKRS